MPNLPPFVVVFRTLAVAALAGALAHFAGMPLAWILGPLWATLLLSARFSVAQPPRWCRRWALALIGCYLGASFTPELAAQMAGAANAMALNIVLTCLCAACGALALRRFFAADRNTAILASVPGGLSAVLALAVGYNANKSMVVVNQVIRVVLIASVLPFLARFMHGAPPPDSAAAPAAFNAAAMAWQAGAFVAALVVARFFASASAYLLWGAFFSGVLYFGGVVTTPMPWQALALAQLVIGVSAAARMPLPELRRAAPASLFAVVIAVLYIGLGALFALLAASFGDIPFLAWFLAFAPGGIAEICLVAQLLDVRPVFVLAAQITRLFFIVIFTPPLIRLLNRARAP